MQDIVTVLSVLAVAIALIYAASAIRENSKLGSRERDIWERIERQLAQETKKRQALEYRVNTLMTGVSILVSQLQREGIEPDWMPVPPIDLMPASGNNIPHMLSEYFDISELMNLAFELGTNWEELPSSNKLGKAIELWRWADRRGETERLLRLCRTKRPKVKWQ